MIEHLEPRKLLAGVSLQKGILRIEGTEDADIVSLEKKRETEVTIDGNINFVDHLLVTLNAAFLDDFRFPDINKVVVKLKGGNDECLVGKKLLKFDIDGGDGDDTMSGGNAGDIIRGGAGQNIMAGGRGNDHFIISSGGDLVTGGVGSDTADFGPFKTTVIVTLDGIANDSEEGRAGNIMPDIETVIGGGGADFISAAGLLNPVELIGGSGKDTLLGGARDDTLRGGKGNDSLRAGEGNDYLNGDAGKDKLFGEDGRDTLNGGGPDPKFIPLPVPVPTDQDTMGGGSDAAADTLNGGAGQDSFIVDPFDIFHQQS